jgi:dTDP-4-dehydrorhamnose 3,5-epimerase-like enzyme
LNGRVKIRGGLKISKSNNQKDTNLDKVHIIDFSKKTDNRGTLVVIEGSQNLEFTIKRVFYMYGMDSAAIRGQHANKESSMCFTCITGTCNVTVDNGTERKTFILNDPAKGLVCESMTWKEMSGFSSDCVLMVMCDTYYDADEYITDYNIFKAESRK